MKSQTTKQLLRLEEGEEFLSTGYSYGYKCTSKDKAGLYIYITFGWSRSSTEYALRLCTCMMISRTEFITFIEWQTIPEALNCSTGIMSAEWEITVPHDQDTSSI